MLDLDYNALTTLPPDVFDSLGSLTCVIPVPRECVVAENVGHVWCGACVFGSGVLDVEGLWLICMRAYC